MKINIAKSAGFCFGVRRAIDIAMTTIASKANVYILGDIVHNEDVIRELKNSGIKKIERLADGRNKTLLIRAHGIGRQLMERIRGRGYNIIDATCPMVKDIHRIAKQIENRGDTLIIIGDKNHDEVHGITGQLKSKTIVIEKPDDIPLSRISKIKSAGIVAQSTQNIENITKILAKLKRHIKKLRFYNTICRPTKAKQEEIKKMPLENDVMIIIGSKSSANTKRLYEISKSLNPKTYWVVSRKDLKPRWFRGVKKVGITAGASTPNSTIKEIIGHLKKMD